MTRKTTPRTKAPILLAALALLVVLGPACGVSDLNLVQDDRVAIVAPADRAAVRLPLTLSWTAKDFDGTYAVFVDRAPVPPGRSLEWLARDDDLCAASPECPTAEWFNARYVYTTPATELTITEVPELTRDERRVFHEATIVLLDDHGERVGESAFTVEFEVERDTA